MKKKTLWDYKVKDLFNEKKKQEMLEIQPDLLDELRKSADSFKKHQKYRIEKNVQPFKTNYLLENLEILTQNLSKSVKELSRSSDKWSFVLAFLSALMVIIASFQIYLVLFYKP